MLKKFCLWSVKLVSVILLIPLNLILSSLTIFFFVMQQYILGSFDRVLLYVWNEFHFKETILLFGGYPNHNVELEELFLKEIQSLCFYCL